MIDVVSVDESGEIQNVPDTGISSVSDTGAVVVYDTIDTEVDDPTDTSRVWVRDRVGETSRPVAEIGSVAPGISANGCQVAYSVRASDGASVSLTVVDRCAAVGEVALPLGTVLDTISLPASEPLVDDDLADGDVVADDGVADDEVADDAVEVDAVEVDAVADGEAVVIGAPALSFDGSTIVWSTGSEIRRYQRPSTDDDYVRTHAFDVAGSPTPDIVTGSSVDVSADGDSVVFVAGPGTQPFLPTPANVYLWQAATAAADPELVSATSSGEPGTADSASPTISNDAAFVVFESSSVDLAAVAGEELTVPFVVGADRTRRTSQILVDDASDPTVSGDGNHVVYRRGAAVRVLSSVGDGSDDADADELATADPIGSVSISQHGRWLVFSSAADLRTTPDPAATIDASVVWSVDRVSSLPDPADTTTTTTTTSTPTTTSTTVPATTLPATPVVLPATPVIDRSPAFPTAFPRVVTPRPTTSSRSVTSVAPSVPATATPATFEPTVVGAGRRTLPVTLLNSTRDTFSVVATSIDPIGPFSITSDGCVGIRLAPSASCAVEVQFAPVDVGATSALAVFALDDGSTVTASLDGVGAPEPTLDLVPAVAGAGQTVTVFGAGFPAGSTVEMMQPGIAVAQPVVVEPDGTFAHVAVILPNTPTGPVLLSVAGQTDLFAGVDAELLVSNRGTASGSAALRGGIGNPSLR